MEVVLIIMHFLLNAPVAGLCSGPLPLVTPCILLWSILSNQNDSRSRLTAVNDIPNASPELVELLNSESKLCKVNDVDTP